MKRRNIIFGAVLSVLVSFALCQQVQTAQDTPDPGSVSGLFNTADGDHALFFNDGAFGNSGFGWFASWANSTGNFNTAAGAAALDLNAFDRNTAVGAAAMLLSQGSDNTAVGAAALENNNADGNTAIGSFALFSLGSGGSADGNTAVGFFAGVNTTDVNNTAVGALDITVNPGITSGHDNTVVGRNAGAGITSGSDNTIVGGDSGTSFFTDSNNVYIGRHVEPDEADLIFDENTIRIGSGVSGSPPMTPGTASCFIDGILQNSVPIMGGQPIVAILPTGQLVQTPDFANKIVEQQKKIEEQQASISQLKSEMQTMVAQLKEQGAQIQKVSAQLEVNKPAAKVVVNKP